MIGVYSLYLVNFLLKCNNLWCPKSKHPDVLSSLDIMEHDSLFLFFDTVQMQVRFAEPNIDMLWTGGSDTGLGAPGMIDKSSKVTTLDQLYSQAHALEPILRNKVQVMHACVIYSEKNKFTTPKKCVLLLKAYGHSYVIPHGLCHDTLCLYPMHTAFFENCRQTHVDSTLTLPHAAQAWADVSYGSFLRDSCAHVGGTNAKSFVPWRAARTSPRTRETILWPTVKPPNRAIQKVFCCCTCCMHGISSLKYCLFYDYYANCVLWYILAHLQKTIFQGQTFTIYEQALHSYMGDVSQLMDLCRQSIYFEDIEPMSTCLDAILHDEEVCVCVVCICVGSSLCYSHVESPEVCVCVCVCTSNLKNGICCAYTWNKNKKLL
jgi:hypothetical protein